jgi:hypothetical protein
MQGKGTGKMQWRDDECYLTFVCLGIVQFITGDVVWYYSWSRRVDLPVGVLREMV